MIQIASFRKSSSFPPSCLYDFIVKNVQTTRESTDRSEKAWNILCMKNTSVCVRVFRAWSTNRKDRRFQQQFPLCDPLCEATIISLSRMMIRGNLSFLFPLDHDSIRNFWQIFAAIVRDPSKIRTTRLIAKYALSIFSFFFLSFFFSFNSLKILSQLFLAESSLFFFLLRALHDTSPRAAGEVRSGRYKFAIPLQQSIILSYIIYMCIVYNIFC